MPWSLPNAPLPRSRELVIGAAAVMIALQLSFRAWALSSSWFYTDDYRLLSDARSHSFGWDYLTLPFDSQFMPFGRAVAAVVAHTDANWTGAATTTLVLQLLASIACVWLLITMFGIRWEVLLLLGLYLTSALTMPAFMWWAAALNQMPLQLVAFVSVACWVRYLRSHRWWWLAATSAALGFGLLCYVKTVLLFPVLCYLLLAYFASGGLVTRIGDAVRRYWPAWAMMLALAGVFTWYYLAQIPSAVGDAAAPLGGLFGTAIGTSLATGLLGGPWHWDTSNPPTAYADPPSWAVVGSWAVLAVLSASAALQRRRTGRAWLLLGGYAGLAFVLVLATRARVVGAAVGLELRYLTDVLPIAVLCLGLAMLPLRGAIEASEPRTRPLLRWSPGPRWATGIAAVVLTGGLWSSATYAHVWHSDNPGADYASAAMTGLDEKGPIDLADQVVPPQVIPGYSAPYNTTARLLPLLVDNARFPDSSSDLNVLDDQGAPHRAVISPVTTSPAGPEPGCGWRVDSAGRTLRVSAPTQDYDWWIRIGYLGAADDDIEVTAAGRTTVARVRGGLQSLFLHRSGVVSSIRITGVDPGNALCVDTVEVGRPEPGAPL